MIRTKSELLTYIDYHDNCWLYGAGAVGKATAVYLNKHSRLDKICGFLESNTDNKEMNIFDLNVFDFHRFNADPDQVFLITTKSRFHSEISEMLRNIGIKEIEYLADECCDELLKCSYEDGKGYTQREKHPDQEKRIRTLRTAVKFEVHLTEHCNLNCKSCYHYSSVAKEEYLNVEKYSDDCRCLSRLYNGNASEILLLGGEPLLHPGIEEIIIVTRRCFPDSEIGIVTNGILLPAMSDKFWAKCRENEIIIRPTKYPINVDYQRIETMAIEKGVRIQFFNDGEIEKRLTYWPIDPSGNQDKEGNFYGCYRANQCITLKDGRLYTCIIPAHIHHLEKSFCLGLPDFTEDGIDIHKALSWEEVSAFLTKPVEACRFCDCGRIVSGVEWAVSERKSEEWI